MNDKYVKLDDVIKTAYDCDGRFYITSWQADGVAFMMKRIPAAPVREVIHCKDCDVPHDKWAGCPKLGGMVPPPLWFCAGAEPKKEATEPICGVTNLPCSRCQPGPCGNRV